MRELTVELIPAEQHDRVMGFADNSTIGASSFIGATVVMRSLEAEHLASTDEYDRLGKLDSRIAATIERKINPDEVQEVDTGKMITFATAMMREGDDGTDTAALGELLNLVEASRVTKDIIRYFANSSSLGAMEPPETYRLLMTMRDAIINDEAAVLPGYIAHTLQDAALEAGYEQYHPDDDVAGMLALAGIPVYRENVGADSEHDRGYFGGGKVADNLSVTNHPFSSVVIESADLLKLFPDDRKAEVEKELQKSMTGRGAKPALLIGDILLDVEFMSENNRIYCFGRKILPETAQHIAGYLADS